MTTTSAPASIAAVASDGRMRRDADAKTRGACARGPARAAVRRPEGGLRPRPAARAMSKRRLTERGTPGPRRSRAASARRRTSRSSAALSRSSTATGAPASAVEDLEEARVADGLTVGDVERLHSELLRPSAAAVLEGAREDPQVGDADGQVQEAETRDEAAEEPRAEEARNRPGGRSRDAGRDRSPPWCSRRRTRRLPRNVEEAPHLRGF